MRRTTALLLGTVAGTALLAGAKYATPGTADGSGLAAHQHQADNAGPSGSASPEPSGSAVPSSSAPASTSPGPVSSPSGLPTGGGGTGAAGGGSGGGSGTGGGSGGSQPTPTKTTAPPTCTTVSGSGAKVASPGVGTMTVTIKVCGGTISTATGSLSESNWSKNDAAIPALNSLAVQYYKTDISRLHYSGATLTSNAYQTSLKSAIAKAGI